MIGNECVWPLFDKAAIIGVILVAVALIATCFLYRIRYFLSRFWRWMERNLYIFFGIVWLCGFAVYCVGMFIYEGDACEGIKWLEIIPLSIIRSFNMFLLQCVVTIDDSLRNNIAYMTCFSLVHFAAAIVSMIFVLKHFGYNVIARTRLWLSACRLFPCKKDRLFIFWGMNEPSFALAKNIIEEAKSGKFSYRMVFVKTPDDEESTDNRLSLRKAFNFSSMKKSELDNYKDLGCLTANAFNSLSKCELHGTGRKTILKDSLGLGPIVKLLKKTKKEVHVFLLDKDEESNIEASAKLCCDEDLNKFADGTIENGNKKEKNKVTVYCHAHFDSINRVVEDSKSNKGIEVRIIDSSHFSITELKSTEAYHPINFVEIDTSDNVGTVKSGFSCMVVGFGETGQNAVRFLYEFGSFVSNGTSKDDDIPGEENTSKKVVKSAFACSVIDQNMWQIKGHLLATSPIFNSNSHFEFLDCDINSEQFYSLLEKKCNELNYIVVALGNDELNITVAVRIFEYFRIHRIHNSNFRIFVRCHSTVHEQHLRDIANHYNEVNAKDNNDKCEHITVFGTLQAIYTYKQIIENDYEKDGKEYNRLYCETSGQKGKKDVWELRHEHFLDQKTLDGYSELRRKESQDIANAYHALTKLHIMRKVAEANLEQTKTLRACLEGDMECLPEFSRKTQKGQKVEGLVEAKAREMQDGTQLSFSYVEQLLFRNLARLEHIRWVASHEMLGYQNHTAVDDFGSLAGTMQKHRCNEQLRLHNCMIGWEELDRESDEAYWENPTMKDEKEYPDYKLYDFIVITTSLKLQSKKRR